MEEGKLRESTNFGPLLLKPTHAARLLDCSRTTIYDLINRGHIKATRVGTLLRIPRSEIERFAAIPTKSSD